MMKVYGWVGEDTSVETYNHSIRELRKSLDWTKGNNFKDT